MKTLSILFLFTSVGFPLFSSIAAVEVNKSSSRLEMPNEIIVKALKKEQRLQDVPASTQVYSKKEVKRAQLNDLVDVISNTPSVNFANAADNHRTPSLSIRGVSSLVLGAGLDQPVAMHLDDVYISSPVGMYFDLFDVESIEVLRGPQGAIYGKNAFAGAINVHSTLPQNKTESKIDLKAGNYNLSRFEGSVNTPLVKDKAFIRLSGLLSQRDGVIENTEGEDIHNKDNWGLRGQVRIVPDKNWDINVSADYLQDRPTVTAGGGFDEVLSEPVSIKIPYAEERDLWGSSVKAIRRGSQVDVTSITAVRSLDFASEGSDFFVPDSLASSKGNDNFIQGQADQQTQLSQELRLSSSQKGKWQWNSGVYFLYEDYDTQSFLQLEDFAAIFGLPNGHRETSLASQITRSSALFGDVSYALTEKLTLNSGLRWTHEEKDFNYDHSAASGTAVVYTDQTFADQQVFDGLTPKLTATYKATPDLTLYASAGRGFKSGGFNNLVVQGNQFEFKEETAWNYELGFKSSWRQRVTLNASLFYFDWKNQQIQTFNQTLGTVTSNASTSTSFGGELEMSVRLRRDLHFVSGYSHANATFDDYKDFPTPTVPGDATVTDVSGNRTPFASKDSFHLGLNYNKRLKRQWRLDGRVAYLYKGPFFFDSLNTLKQDGYGLVNSQLGLSEKDWRVYLWGKNITNTKYRSVAIDRGPHFGVAAAPGEPVTYGLGYQQVF